MMMMMMMMMMMPIPWDQLAGKPLSSLKSGQGLPGNRVFTKVPWTLKIHTKFKPQYTLATLEYIQNTLESNGKMLDV